MPVDDRADRPRRPAIHRDVEGGAALHREADEVGRGVGGDRRLRGCRTSTTRACRTACSRSPMRFNEEYHELADAGCPVIQIEEPQIHLIAVRKRPGSGDQSQADGRSLQPHGEGAARQDRGLGAFVLGQSFAAAHVRVGAELQARARDCTTQVDADVITFESSSSGGIDLEAIGKIITGKKVSIGVIDHHTLQVEQPEQVAGADPRRAQAHPGRAAGDFHRLRHGPRGHEPAARRSTRPCRWCSAPTSCARRSARRRRRCWRPTSAIRWWSPAK